MPRHVNQSNLMNTLRITQKGHYKLANGWVVTIDIVRMNAIGGLLPTEDGNWQPQWWKKNGEATPANEDLRILHKVGDDVLPTTGKDISWTTARVVTR